jgi:hypothetical protein
MEHYDKASIEHDIGKTMTFSKVFAGTSSFDAVNDAEAWLAKHGYSYGYMEQNAPIGISKVFRRISKWYNMTTEDHRQLDGAMVSDDFRDGSVTVYLDRAPRGLSTHRSSPHAATVRAAEIEVAEAAAAAGNAGNRDYAAANERFLRAQETARLAHIAAGRVRAPRKPSGKTTLATAKKELSALGMSLRKSDGEYRVTFRGVKPGRAEEVSYYTDDIDDAVKTGTMMSKERSKV